VHVSSPQHEPIAYRNFNLCPHCIFRGEQSLLCRLREGMPMISRSDGKTFHLLLADYPAPFPAERGVRGSAKTSFCFWYSHVRDPRTTHSTVVVLRNHGLSTAGLFRLIETAADLLAQKLMRSSRLPTFYEFVDGSLSEVNH
jgi:hypothetical protein